VGTVREPMSWDYIVVGAGSAGCVLADRLSERPDTRVLVLDAGTSDRHPAIHVPAGLVKLPATLDWRYEAEPDASRKGQADKWAAGKVLGGGSSVNGMIWVRGCRADYDSWAKDGCDGWAYDDVLPLFRRAETFEDGDSDVRGGAGPQHVARSKVKHRLTDAFVEAAGQVGLPFNADYNGVEQAGASYAQVSQRRGFRWSTARGYLHRARRRANCSVWTSAQVTRVLVEEGRALGVEFVRDGKRETVRCAGEVILAAGSIGSPKLLLLSGIGPASHLEELGLPVVADSPNVGRNLQEHPVGTMQYAVNVKTLNQATGPIDVLRAGLDFIARGRGPVTATAAQAIAFGPLTGTDPRSEVEIMFGPFGIMGEVSEQGETYEHDVHGMKLAKVSAVTFLPCVLHPRSRGTVTLRSADPFDPPRIRHELFGDPTDLERMVDAVRLVRRLVSAPAFAEYVVRETWPGESAQTDDELADVMSTISFRGEHPVATCAMGPDEAAVVDPRLRVRGVSGLRVVDASVMPSLPSGNTNAAAIMIGEKGADLVLADSAPNPRSTNYDKDPS